MKVHEIYYGLQGEGIHQGLPTVFIRLQGCNLRCSWCDTTYAQDPDKGREMSVEEIVAEVDRLLPLYPGWVCITGGEPLLQESILSELVRNLRYGRYKVEIETNGSLPVPWWYREVTSWVADIKCPSSGVYRVSDEAWFDLRAKDQVKFVVGNREDLEFAKVEIERHRSSSPTILVSPVMTDEMARGLDGGVFELGKSTILPDELIMGAILQAKWMQIVVEFCKEMRVRFSLQIQKVVYGNRKGV